MERSAVTPASQPVLIPDERRPNSDTVISSSADTPDFTTLHADQLGNGHEAGAYSTPEDIPLGSSLVEFEPLAPYYGDDFTSFMDSVPIPSHPFSPIYQPLPTFFLFPGLSFPTPVSYENCPRADWSREQGTTVRVDSALSSFGSRFPSLQPEDPPHERHLNRTASHHSLVSLDCLERLSNELSGFANVKEDFVLPTRHMLSRFVAGYMNGFQEHCFSMFRRSGLNRSVWNCSLQSLPSVHATPESRIWV